MDKNFFQKKKDLLLPGLWGRTQHKPDINADIFVYADRITIRSFNIKDGSQKEENLYRDDLQDPVISRNFSTAMDRVIGK